MKYMITTLAVILAACALACAGEEKPKTKGLEIVTDTATSVVNKAAAMLEGDLEIKQEIGRDKFRNDYDMDPLGRKIPRGTLKKYDSGVR
jgi:hypothetical protein